MLCLLSQAAFALNLTPSKATLLSPEQAFESEVFLQDATHAHFLIRVAANHYVYRSKLTLQGSPAKALVHWSAPKGVVIQDPYFGEQAILKNDIDVPFEFTPDIQNITLALQGCAESGFCYPPITRFYQKTAEGFEFSAVPLADNTPEAPKALWWMALGFLGLGLALSITPCVLPMVPILCNLLLSQKNHFFARAMVALSYVSGVILAYTVVGMIAARLGVFIQGVLQQTWVVMASSVVLILLALWQVEWIRLPGRLAKPLKSHHVDKEISLIFAFIMGLVSVAVVSPCVTPPLIVALGYISQTGSMAKGALLLAMSGIGLSIPLLVVAFFGTGVLPKRGQWMHHVKEALSLGLLAVALSLIARIVSPTLSALLWLLYFLLIAVWLWRWKAKKKVQYFAKLVAIVFVFVSIFAYCVVTAQNHTSQALTVTTPQMLDQTLADAAAHHQLAILDIYADWCTNCREIESNIFENTEIQEKLKSVLLIKVDLSVFNQDAQALLSKLDVVAPPTLIFWHPEKGELKENRLVGEVSKAAFEKALKRSSHL